MLNAALVGSEPERYTQQGGNANAAYPVNQVIPGVPDNQLSVLVHNDNILNRLKLTDSLTTINYE
jgi:hypothetical protein